MFVSLKDNIDFKNHKNDMLFCGRHTLGCCNENHTNVDKSIHFLFNFAEKYSINEEVKNELINAMNKWFQHISRKLYSEQYLDEIQKYMDMYQIFVIMDYKMKTLYELHRESKLAFYGKSGIKFLNQRRNNSWLLIILFGCYLLL
jgi:hypothetical protein